MAPNTSAQNLLYASGVCGGICVFSYPTGSLVGELSDANGPYGECVDASGDVFVANEGFSQTPGIYEYQHGATTPVVELSDPGYHPRGCAIDPTTGNLAVAAFSLSGNGAVAIYAKARGIPTEYGDPKIKDMVFCTYDDKGDLFIDGSSDLDAPLLAELPSGANTFRIIKLPQNLAFLQSIQWTGKYLAVTSYNGVISHIFISGSRGIVRASTLLNGKLSVYSQFWIQKNTVIAPYEVTSKPYTGGIGFWSYPAGGRVRKSIIGSQFTYGGASGVAVSPAAAK